MLMWFCVLFDFWSFPNRWENREWHDKSTVSTTVTGEQQRMGKSSYYIGWTEEGAREIDSETHTVTY